MLLAGCVYIASIINAKGSGNIMVSGAILKVCVYFVGFVDSVTISTSVFLSVWFYLRLAESCLLFVLETIIEDNKIDYKDNSGKIRTAARTTKTIAAR